MHTQRRLPVLITASVAVLGSAVIFFNNFGPDNGPQDRAKAAMITAAAVARAGAIEIPSVSSNEHVARS
jgi:hypothetical protein